MRLRPGQDLRATLEAQARHRQWQAACVLSGIGSFTRAVLRYADRDQGTLLAGPLELLSLAGTLSMEGVHLHASVADGQGAVRGGHVLAGCEVRTTAELVVGVLDGWSFQRTMDPATGYPELVPTCRGT